METLDNVAGRLEQIEKRTLILEDIEALKKLKARYGMLCDEKYRDHKAKSEEEVAIVAREISELFTPDAVWDAGGKFGINRGRNEIFEYFKTRRFDFACHYFVMPYLDLQGDRARARWYLFQPTTIKEAKPVWMSGYEDDEYVKVDGRWYISNMKLILNFLTPYDEGWVKNRIVA